MFTIQQKLRAMIYGYVFGYLPFIMAFFLIAKLYELTLWPWLLWVGFLTIATGLPLALIGVWYGNHLTAKEETE